MARQRRYRREQRNYTWYPYYIGTAVPQDNLSVVLNKSEPKDYEQVLVRQRGIIYQESVSDTLVGVIFSVVLPGMVAPNQNAVLNVNPMDVDGTDDFPLFDPVLTGTFRDTAASSPYIQFDSKAKRRVPKGDVVVTAFHANVVSGTNPTVSVLGRYLMQLKS